MKLKFIKINNYKSFANDCNQLFVSELNTIVGKNESGKSNLIEAIGNINKIGATSIDYFKNINKNSKEDISIELTFELDAIDKKRYNYHENVIVSISGYKNCEFDEKFGDVISSINNLSNIRDEILRFINENSIPISKPENKLVYDPIIEGVKQINKKIIFKPDSYDNFINRLIGTKNEVLMELCNLFEKLFKILDEVYPNFPEFILISSNELKKIYTSSELYDELDSFSSILYQFLEVCKINSTDIIETSNLDDAVEILNRTNEYNNLIRTNFVEKFNNFYKQEIIDMVINFNSHKMTVAIKTKGRFLPIEERSNGLKWYINIFIQLMFRDLIGKSRNKIILLDEPGVFLHSIAQEELLSLLYDLSTRDNQVIYTTHSPTMINFDKIQNIRAIEKDDNGNSCIYNKISEFPISSKSKYETITPIINAMGYKMKYNIGINSKKFNLIVEGITDYLYLQSYINIKKIKDYNIIASTGADNIPAISSILYGWGCQFIIVLDNDNKGRSVYDSINSSDMPYKDKIIFVNGKKYTKNLDEEIEDIFSEEDKIKFNLNSLDYKDKKYFYAYACYERIKTKVDKFDNQTISNFDRLFKNIGDLKK